MRNLILLSLLLGGCVSSDPVATPISLVSVTADVLDLSAANHTWVVHPRLLDEATASELELWAASEGIALDDELGFVVGPAHAEVLSTLEDCDAVCVEDLCTLPSACHGFVITRDAMSDYAAYANFIQSEAPSERVEGEAPTHRPRTTPEASPCDEVFRDDTPAPGFYRQFR